MSVLPRQPGDPISADDWIFLAGIIAAVIFFIFIMPPLIISLHHHWSAMAFYKILGLASWGVSIGAVAIWLIFFKRISL